MRDIKLEIVIKSGVKIRKMLDGAISRMFTFINEKSYFARKSW